MWVFSKVYVETSYFVIELIISLGEMVPNVTACFESDVCRFYIFFRFFIFNSTACN